MSHHSLLRESLIPTSSPLRRKSLLNLINTDTSLRQNDDDAERMELRRSAEIQMRQRNSMLSTQSSDKRMSVGGSITGLSPTQLAEHYANCIKLSAKNKINTKNAFSLQLIDYMAMMLKKKDSKMDNFQVASCTLDASTKIYACRVDSVHTDVLKMVSGLSFGFRKKNMDTVSEEKEDSEGGDRNSEVLPTFRRRKSKKPKSTIASSVETLNGKPEPKYTMDPFFMQSTGNMSDYQPGGCHFITSLKVLSNCSLILSSDMPYWDSGDGVASKEKVHVSLPDLSNKPICSVFSNFQFTSWSLEAEEEEESDVPSVFHNVNDDFAFDVNAVPEPVPDNNMPVDNFEMYGVDDGSESDGEEAPALAAAHSSSVEKIIDLRKHLAKLPSEYTYFRRGALDLWAGPSHWKIRPLRQSAPDGTGKNAGSRKQKPKQSNELTLGFQTKENINVLIEPKRKELRLKERTLQKVWNAEKNTHPPDVHYDYNHFQQLQIRKLIGVNMDPVLIEDDQAPDCHNGNDHDTADYLPNDELDDDMEDADCDDNDLTVGQHQDVHTSCAIEAAFVGDNLVAPPNKVARLFIPYAQRAKKMDMNKLKTAIWDILVGVPANEDITDYETLRVETPVKFTYLYKVLPLRLPSILACNLSSSLAVVALLMLANEKNLHIEGEENLDNLTITQS